MTTKNSSMTRLFPSIAFGPYGRRPSVEGGVRSGSATFDWGKFLKVLIAVLTALAGSLGLASCV